MIVNTFFFVHWSGIYVVKLLFTNCHTILNPRLQSIRIWSVLQMVQVKFFFRIWLQTVWGYVLRPRMPVLLCFQTVWIDVILLDTKAVSSALKCYKSQMWLNSEKTLICHFSLTEASPIYSLSLEGTYQKNIKDT